MKVSSCAEENESQRLDIQAFFDAVASRPDARYTCTLCGREMKYLDATFLLYGTDSSWQIRLPICDCKSQ